VWDTFSQLGGNMTNHTDKTRELIAKILRTTADKLSAASALGEVEHWDSLAQLMIISSLEQEFGLSIEPEVAVDLNTVGKICAFVESHGAV
jgi:acyl carrier protein